MDDITTPRVSLIASLTRRLLLASTAFLLAICLYFACKLQMKNWRYPTDANGIECAFIQFIVRLNSSLPLYSPIGQADGSIYHPGGAIVSWMLLKPLGLTGSLHAVRLTQTVFVAISILFLTVVCLREYRNRSSAGTATERICACLLVGLIHVSLATFGFCSPNSLLELFWAMTLLLGSQISMNGIRRSNLICWGIACFGLLFTKQPGLCFSFSAALALCCSIPGARNRIALLSATSIGLILAFFTLYCVGGNDFLEWCYVVPGQQPLSISFLARSDGMGGSIDTIALGAAFLGLWLLSRSESKETESPSARFLCFASILAGACGIVFSSKVGAGPAHFLPMIDAGIVLSAPAIIRTLRNVIATDWTEIFQYRTKVLFPASVLLLVAISFQVGGTYARYYAYWKYQPLRTAEMKRIIQLGTEGGGQGRILYMAHGYGNTLGNAKIVPNENALWDLTQAQRDDCIAKLRTEIASCKYDAIVIQSCIAAGNAPFAKTLTENYVLQPGFGFTQVYVRPNIALSNRPISR